MAETNAGDSSPLVEIGKEYPPPGEPGFIERLRELHLKVHHVQPGADRRGEHPKQHGGVWARFRVEADIPQELRTGLFTSPRSYSALVRFSNGRVSDDRMPDVHGMAVKVLVPRGDGVPFQQDFILADHPVFFARDVEHTLAFLSATANGTPPGQLATTTHPALIGFTKKVNSSPLALRYWSQTPYKAGGGAVKYAIVPAPSEDLAPFTPNDSPDFLREAMAEQLTYQKVPATFALCVNQQTDARGMPIEDATIEWKSELTKLASISICPQKFDSPEQSAFVDSLAWTPWNSLPEHRPLGGISRARQAIYRESMELRHRTKGIGQVQLTGREFF